MFAFKRIAFNAIGFLFFCNCLLVNNVLMAQAPDGINYQAVARDNNGNALDNRLISVRFGVLANSPTGTVLHEEEHSLITTNDFGLFNLVIGDGTRISGTAANFASIDWSNTDHFLRVQIDAGNGFENLGTTQLLSVPYALYAKTSGSVNNNLRGGDGIIVRNDSIINDGDLSDANELISSFSILPGNILRISEASVDYDVDLTPLLIPNTDNQNLRFNSTGDSILIDGGDGIDITPITNQIAANTTDIASNLDSITDVYTNLLARMNADSLLRYINDTTLSGELRDTSAALRGLINSSNTDDQQLSFNTARDSILLEDGSGVSIADIRDSLTNYNTRISTNETNITTNTTDIASNLDSITDVYTNLLARMNADSLLRYINDTTLSGELRDTSAILRGLINSSNTDDQQLSFNTGRDSILLEDGSGVSIADIRDSLTNYNTRISTNETDIATNQINITTNTTDIASNLDSITDVYTNLLARMNADSLLRYINDTTLSGELRDTSAILRGLINSSNTDDQQLSFNTGRDSILLEDGSGVSIADIRDSMTNYNTRISANEMDIATNQSSIATNSADIANNQTGISRIISRLVSDSTSNADSLAAIRSDLNGLNIVNYDPRITADSIRLENLRAKLVADSIAIDAAISSNTTNISTNTTNISINTTDISDNASAISSLDARHVADSTSNADSLAAIRADLNGLNIVNYDPRITADSIRLENLRAKLVADSIAIDAAISSNTTNITTNTTDIANLTNQVNSIDTTKIQFGNTGVFIPTINDAISFQTDGSTALTIDQNQRSIFSNLVGIGTPTPSAFLGIVSNNEGIPSANFNTIGGDAPAQGLIMNTDGAAQAAYGIYSNTFGASNAIGIRSLSSSSTTNTSDSSIAIFARSTGLNNVYSGFFDRGNVFIRDTLILPTGASNGYVLTSDPNGKAVWSDLPPVGGVFEKVGGVIRDTTANYNSDFVIGSPQLDDDGTGAHDSRMFFDKSKSSFRVGVVNGSQWDDANVGSHSTAFGWNNTASGNGSAVIGGSRNIASSGPSVVIGGGTNTASGNSSAVIGGSLNIAGGLASVAFGIDNRAQSRSEFIIGEYNDTLTSGFNTNSFVSTDRLLVIGNGTADNARSNALVMLKNGNTTLNGELTLSDGASSFTLPNIDGTAGQILQTDGSGNITWQSPSGNGIYGGTGTLSGNTEVTQGANSLSFTSTATNAFSIDTTTFVVNAANNKVGIGTATLNSNSSLEISGTGLYGAGLELRNGASRVAISNDASALRFIKVDGATNTHMTIMNNTGNVGIGTTLTPDSTLTVNGGIKTTYFTLTDGAASGSVLTSDANGVATWQVPAPTGNVNTAGGNTINRLAYWNSADSLTYFDDVYIDTANNRIGIGTTSPSQKLQVNGGIRVSAGFNANNGTQGSPSFRFESDANTGMFNAAADQLGFTTGGVEALRIDASGNVGIGTAIPDSMLEVNGGVKVGVLNVNGAYTLPVTDGIGQQFLQTDGSGNVSWSSTLPSTNCPTGMTNVNGNICIETNERAASDWYDAASTCASLGYKLPSWAEWYGAASNAVLTNESNNWEWVSDGTSNTARKVGNGDIKATANDDPELGSASFRCIFYK